VELWGVREGGPEKGVGLVAGGVLKEGVGAEGLSHIFFLGLNLV
jgi:hypothetical protein